MENHIFNKRNKNIACLLILSLFILPANQATNNKYTLSNCNILSATLTKQNANITSQSYKKNIQSFSSPINFLTNTQLNRNQRILTNLKSFQHLTENYIHQLKPSKATPSPALLMASFIRTGTKRYTGTEWKALAGSEEKFNAYVKKAKGNKCAYYLRSVEYYYDPVTGEEIDFIHMIASLNVYLENELMYRLYPQIGDIGGWAGDCIQLASEGKKYKISAKRLNDFYNDRIGKEGSFGGGDILADIDALNIYTLLKDKGEFTNAFKYYYNTLCKSNRYQLFIQNRFHDAISLKELKQEIQKVLTKKSYLMSLVLDREGLILVNDKRYLEEAGDCFASYVWERRDENAR